MLTDSFLQILYQHKDCCFYLSAAAGNSGDRLLQTGLELYLHNNDFWLTDQIDDAGVVLTHGGSNINDVWKTGVSLFTDNLKKYQDKIFIVAPHTFTFLETNLATVLAPFSQPIYLFAREQTSFTYLQSLPRKENISIGIADDTAFLLEGSQYLEQLRSNCTNDYTLFAMRTDKESQFILVNLNHPPRNFVEKIKFHFIQRTLRHTLQKPMSSRTEADTRMVDISYLPYDKFISKVQHAAEVHTDRLHVGILAALLNKPVYLYDTKHHKVSAVYKQSLYRYTNVIPMFTV